MGHYHDPEYESAREKLTEAIKAFASAVHDDSSLVLGATVVYERTVFDDDGSQNYATHHVVLDPGSLAHAVGLLETAKAKLVAYINSPEED